MDDLLLESGGTDVLLLETGGTDNLLLEDGGGGGGTAVPVFLHHLREQGMA